MAARERKSLHADPRARMPKFEARSHGLSPYEDAYHWILTRTWARFFMAVALAFVLVNVAFAGLFSLEPGAIRNADTFVDRFFFSIQPLGTIGYGVMYPATRWASVIVSVEALVGLLFAALVTGLTFARFAKPTARILFSERAVI